MVRQNPSLFLFSPDSLPLRHLLRRLKKFVTNLCVLSSLNMINRTHPNSTHTTWIMSFCLPCKAGFITELRFGVTSLLIVKGPSASEYNTSSFLTSRFFLISVIQNSARGLGTSNGSCYLYFGSCVNIRHCDKHTR